MPHLVCFQKLVDLLTRRPVDSLARRLVDLLTSKRRLKFYGGKFYDRKIWR